MLYLSFLLSLVLLVLVLPQRALSSTTNNVIDLTSANFAKQTSNGDAWMLLFYAPWCGHCKKVAPIYERTATTMENQYKPEKHVSFGQVDGNAEKGLSARFSLTGFPTIFHIEANGKAVRTYSGQRTEDAFVAFALGKYKDVEPIPYITSPFGPLGQAKAIILSIGFHVIGIYDTLVKDYGIDPLLAGFLIVGLGSIGGVIFVLLLAWLTTPNEVLMKMKEN
jgi:protein disulfide-isomerase-like protein